MKKNLQQLGLMILTLLLVVYGSSFITPPKVQAQYVVEDVYNGVVDTLTSIASGASEYIQEAMQIEDSELKDIAISIAKQMLQQLTLSVIKWINSGFNGSPAFVQNPASYFENLGDDIAGNFLQQNGNLKFLCSPFSLDIRIALAVKMQKDTGQQYTCTLTKAISNATNAVNGASITGFMSGDFSQGGFPAMLTIATDPQNTAGGAYLQAEQDLAKKISTSVNQKVNELAQGGGFLSYQSCTYSDVDPDTGDSISITKAQYASSTEGDSDDDQGTATESCTTQTPGSVISGVLDKHLGVPTDELELANDLNSIISAAFSELVLQVFSGGLGSVTGSGSSGSAYLNTLAAQSTAQNQQLQSSVAQGLAPNLLNAQNYKANVDQSLSLATTAYNDLQTDLTCWTNPLIVNTPQAQSQISIIQNSYIPTLAPTIAEFSGEDQSASSSIAAILAIENSTNLTNQSLQVSSLTADQLITTQQVGLAQQAIKTTQNTVTPIETSAKNSYLLCQTALTLASSSSALGQ